ncbi:MAG: hypothetical protein AB9921_11820 [Erysipelotrichaceae bacterium]
MKSYKVHTFHDIVFEDVSIYGWYVVSGKNKKEVDSFTEYLVSSLPQTVSVAKPGDTYAGEILNVTPRNEILFISFVLFLLVLFMEVSKNMKEISLRKSMGESFVTIEIDLFSSFVWNVLISSVLSFMISYIILIQTFNRYTIPFIQQLVAYFIVIIVITLILMILLGGILYLVSPVNVIKNRNISKTLFNFNFIIKIIFLVFLFPQFNQYAVKAIDLSGQLGAYLQTQEEISSVVEIKAFSLGSEAMGNNDLLKEFVLEFKPKWVEMSDFYFDEQSKDMPEEINTPFDSGYFDYLYLRVDAKYLDYFPIKVNGELLKVSEKPILLIPESRRKSIGYSFIGLCDECKRVITKDKLRVSNFDNPAMFPYYENPVMIIYPSVNVNDERFSESNLRIIETSSSEALLKVSDLTAFFDKNVVFTNNQDDLQRKITDLGTIWYYAFIVFLQGLGTIILVIIHGVTVLFQLNRKEIAIHYTIGYSFLQRSLYIVLQDIILFGLLWIYLLINKYSMLNATKYALIVVALDFAITSIYLNFNEKKQAIDAIKNS